MGELLGIGITHGPHFQFRDEDMANILKRQLKGEKLPDHLRDPTNWPTEMQQEWGDDEGMSAARRHREIVVEGFRRVREELDAFQPDFILVFGDDQYENFREDVVPAFCVYFFDAMKVLPFQRDDALKTADNIWGESEDEEILVHGHRDAGLHLTTELLRSGFDPAWSMKPHHHPTLGHAFMRTWMYLDYDRRGLDFPLIPFHVNSYGEDIAHNLDGGDGIGQAPPAPTPARCFEIGREVGRILRASPYRVAIVGSASWSHAFLTPKNHGFYPDVASDRERAAELRESRHREWGNLSLEVLRDAGQHELLNWVCMAGAMADAKAEVVAYAETYIFNSTKVVALLRDD